MTGVRALGASASQIPRFEDANRVLAGHHRLAHRRGAGD